MKTALLADIHANLEALSACIAHARREGVERFAFLGDIVGYGASPVECLEIVQDLASGGSPSVLGNHDQAALGGLCEEMHALARDAIYWTRTRLGPRERAFLEGLPLTRSEGDVLYAHASASQPGQWEYVASARQAERCLSASQARIVFLGHVHEGHLYQGAGQGALRPFQPVPGVPIPLMPHRRYVIIVGSAGQPRDGSPAAQYGIHDDAEATWVSHRVPYDSAGAAARIRAAGLPERLALRLETGR